MKHADFSRTPRVSLFTTLVRKSFVFLAARIHRSRVAALGAALLALFFARRLMTQTAARQEDARTQGRVIDGEYRRVHEPR
ncbi:MAG: hypothetical protein EKK46_08055 [Rhodocyclaceae bacterium]|nr:MAG: hypothetical protein EKK46_08055 [Rhodocyclaceae bacterium]